MTLGLQFAIIPIHMSREALESFINPLGVELRAKIAAHDRKGAHVTKDLMMHGSRLHARGLVNFQGFLESPTEISGVTVIVKDNPIDHLAKVVAEYRNDTHNPELVTAFQQAFWQVPRGERKYTFKVGECDWTRDDMACPLMGIKRAGKEFYEVRNNGVMVALPDDFKGKQGLILAGKVWPELSHWSVKESTPITDSYDATGYLKVEASSESPNRDTLRLNYAHLITPYVRGQRLITYIIASKQNREVNHHDFDIHSWSRLPGSRQKRGRQVITRFFSTGLAVYWSRGSWDHDANMGVRFEEVNSA